MIPRIICKQGYNQIWSRKYIWTKRENTNRDKEPRIHQHNLPKVNRMERSHWIKERGSGGEEIEAHRQHEKISDETLEAL